MGRLSLRYTHALVGLVVALVFSGCNAAKPSAASSDPNPVEISLDLKRPGVQAENVVTRSLYFAKPDAPKGLGPEGIGTFGPGRVTLPFTVEKAGRYTLVLSYALAAGPRTLSIVIDQQPEIAAELWPTSPDYPWGSSHLYGKRWPPPADWQSETPYDLASGPHTLRLNFSAGDLLLMGARLDLAEVGSAGQNQVLRAANPQPWLQAGYVPFPALVFTDRKVENSRITFNGTWTNLAPGPVSYRLSAAVMPRSGASRALFKVIESAETLQLPIGGSTPFTLTVEAAQTLPALDYSEMVMLKLTSNDLPGLSKPYLMTTATSYLAPRTQTKLRYVRGEHDGKYAVADDTDWRHVLPTRETLGLQDGRYARTLTEAFLEALRSASPPVRTRPSKPGTTEGVINLTEWAKTSPDAWEKQPYRMDWRHPLARLLIAPGLSDMSTESLRRMMMLLNEEMPFYPVDRWDSAQPLILPVIQYERTGTGLLASYLRLVQEKVISDDEHFRILHNVILPLYTAFRDDLRIGGTLAEAARAGDTTIRVQRDTAPNIFPEEMTGDWLRIGSGATTDYVRVQRRDGEGKIELGTDFPGPLKFDHPAGEVWVSFHMREWLELEATEIWSFLTLAAASRDSAIVEQCIDMLATLYETQNVFKEDGSFANEPGSYGWSAFEYIALAGQIRDFLGEDVLLAALWDRLLKALVLWNDFPFSDGLHPMLNRGGGNNQLGRQDDAFKLLVELFPEQTDLIQRYRTIIDQEKKRAPGTTVDNRSFLAEGWGYAMLRGPGTWDSRMETLIASKKILSTPGDHTSRDTLGIVIFANGAIMTPRYGYDWRSSAFPLLNMVRIDHEEPAYWGDFLHFDPDPNLPSAVAFTDMAVPYQTAPGLARQERWLVQLPEYLFDAYFVRPNDGQSHVYEWGYRNLGEVAPLASVPLNEVKNADGTPWEPFKDYLKNTSQRGQAFTTDTAWGAQWTMNEGNVSFPTDYPHPPKGATMRLTMEGASGTRVILAWLDGPARNDKANLRQDFVVVERSGTNVTFISAFEPVKPGQQARVQEVVTLATDPPGPARVVKVVTRDGADYFLVGTPDFAAKRAPRQIGPFTTDAALAFLRVQGGKVVNWMFAGGSSLEFADASATLTTQETHAPR